LTKAKVEILQKRTAENKIIIEAAVEIKGIIRRKRYFVDASLNNDGIRKHISDEIIKEETKDVVGEKFDVEIK